jgi:aerobic carbon-monoxide dehydrogenase small subunit
VLLRLVLNGRERRTETEPLRRLLDVLREDFGLTGVKEGCGEGECGACMVILDGRIVNSCLVPAGSVNGSEVVTIEGFRETERYRMLEECFVQAGAVQCGFCTPGVVLAAEALLRENAAPDDDDIREAISGNLCRCTGYDAIVEGIRLAARRGSGLW